MRTDGEDVTRQATHGRVVLLDPRNVWRVGLVVIALVALVVVLRFVLGRGSSLIFTLVMAWFAALAMEPLVARLARRMRRGAATGVVLGGVFVALAAFLAIFGQLIVTQVAQLVQNVPALALDALAWVNDRFGTAYTVDELVANVDLSPERAAGVANQLAGGVLAVLGSVAGVVAGSFVFVVFVFYLSADGPRVRRWIASLFPAHVQRATVAVWDITAEKTGRYVGARIVLAAVNSAASAVVFAIVGLPSWLALALWTGVVAQFVPSIGTYIAIALPALVGLLSPDPWLGVIIIGWGVLYQQIENLVIEPPISARAVAVHPAVSFAAVILGTALFGVAGALLAVPVAAMLLALLDLYRKRYDLLPELQELQEERRPGPPRQPRGTSRRSRTRSVSSAVQPSGGATAAQPSRTSPS